MDTEHDDRLLRLGMARAALRWARINSVDEYRRATRAQLAHLGDYGALLHRLIREGRPDVLAALFEPQSGHDGDGAGVSAVAIVRHG